MNQYLDEKDGKWHITMNVSIPRVLIKNKLNFRLYSVTMKNGKVIRDPSLKLSKYVFGISPSLMGRVVFFNTSFDVNEISEISEFKLGLCDERIRWYEDTFISIENNLVTATLIKQDELAESEMSVEVSETATQEFVLEMPLESSSPMLVLAANPSVEAELTALSEEIPAEVENDEATTITAEVTPLFTTAQSKKKQRRSKK